MNEDKPPTLANLCTQFIAENSHRWRRNSLRVFRDELERFKLYVGDRELTPKILSEFQADQYNRGVKQNTVRRTLNAVKQLIDWAEDMEIFEANRFSRVIDVPSAVQKKARTFSPEQFERLKELSRGTFWHYAIVMAYRTGARYSDCALLKWEGVDLDKCYVRFVPFKTRQTGREAVCPFKRDGDLHLALLEMNAAEKHPHPMWAPYVCPEMAMYYPQDNAIDDAGNAGPDRRYEFRVLCQKAGAVGLSFHQLRNSFISRLVNSGASFPKGSQITGLASQSVFNRYAEPDIESLRETIENMDKKDQPPDEGTIIKMPGAA